MSDTLHTLHVGLPHVLASYAGELARTQPDTLSRVIGARIDALAVEKEPRFYFEKAAFRSRAHGSTGRLNSLTVSRKNLRLFCSDMTFPCTAARHICLPHTSTAQEAFHFRCQKYRRLSISKSAINVSGLILGKL